MAILSASRGSCRHSRKYFPAGSLARVCASCMPVTPHCLSATRTHLVGFRRLWSGLASERVGGMPASESEVPCAVSYTALRLGDCVHLGVTYFLGGSVSSSMKWDNDISLMGLWSDLNCFKYRKCLTHKQVRRLAGPYSPDSGRLPVRMPSVRQRVQSVGPCTAHC